MVQIEIIGNLGADVVEKDYNGNKFYTFNICDNRKVNGSEISQWFSCNLNRATEVLQYLVKGQQVFVRGIPRFRIFDSAVNHCKMVGIEVFVNEIQLIGAAPRPSLTPEQANGIARVLLEKGSAGDAAAAELAAAFTLAFPAPANEGSNQAPAQEQQQAAQQPEQQPAAAQAESAPQTPNTPNKKGAKK